MRTPDSPLTNIVCVAGNQKKKYTVNVINSPVHHFFLFWGLPTVTKANTTSERFVTAVISELQLTLVWCGGRSVTQSFFPAHRTFPGHCTFTAGYFLLQTRNMFPLPPFLIHRCSTIHQFNSQRQRRLPRCSFSFFYLNFFGAWEGCNGNMKCWKRSWSEVMELSRSFDWDCHGESWTKLCPCFLYFITGNPD